MFVQVVDFKASGFVTLPVAAAVAVAHCTFQLLVLLVLFLPAVSVFPDILISCFYCCCSINHKVVTSTTVAADNVAAIVAAVADVATAEEYEAAVDISAPVGATSALDADAVAVAFLPTVKL